MKTSPEVIDRIEALAKAAQREVKVLEANGRTLVVDVQKGTVIQDVSQPLVPNKLPEGQPIAISTLAGLVEFVKAALHKHDPKDVQGAEGAGAPAFLHVVSPTKVAMVGDRTFGGAHQREVFAIASIGDLTAFPFGDELEAEEFIIKAMTLIQPSEGRDQVIAFVSRLTTGPTLTSEDTGVGQQVTLRKGITANETAEFKNPAVLRPWRTFREVAQPESPFILRMSGGSATEKPDIVLHEADGGAWKNAATQEVAKYLRENLPGATVVA